MNIKIDIRRVLAEPLHPIRILLYVAVTVVLMGQLQDRVLRWAGWGNQAAPVFHTIPQAQPAILAGAVEVADGMLEFSGGAVRRGWTGPVSSALVAMILQYVVGPAILVWGLRAWVRYRRHEEVRGGATTIAVALAIGGFCLVTLLPAPLYAIRGSRFQETMRRDQEVMSMADAMQLDLYMMARKAQVKYFCPAGRRERQHSWLTHGATGSPAIRIADLLEQREGVVFTDSMTARINDRTITMRVERGDSLTIRGEFAIPGGTLAYDPGARPLYSVTLCVGVSPERLSTAFNL